MRVKTRHGRKKKQKAGEWQLLRNTWPVAGTQLSVFTRRGRGGLTRNGWASDQWHLMPKCCYRPSVAAEESRINFLQMTSCVTVHDNVPLFPLLLAEAAVLPFQYLFSPFPGQASISIAVFVTLGPPAWTLPLWREASGFTSCVRKNAWKQKV